MVQKLVVSIKGGAAVLLKPRKYIRDIKKELTYQLPYPPSKGQIVWCYFDFLLFRLKYGGSLKTDYFKAQLYRKSGIARKESLSRYVRYPWRNAIQERELWPIFSDKRKFYEAFSEYLNRDWMVVDGNTSWEKFRDFLAGKEQIFTKIPIAYGGADVHCVTVTEEKKRALYEQCRKESCIIEDKITQCEEIYSFSNASINTLRIITLVDRHNVPHVAAALLRMGNGASVVDNFTSGGMCAVIDIKTGIISSPARDGKGIDYLVHPNTGKQIIGFKIPDWEGYKNFALKLAAKFPGMRYVGWDVIKDSNGNYTIIEGNKDAGVGGIECHVGYGLKPYYDAVLNCDENFDYSRMP